MSQSKIEVRLGDIHFVGEGEQGWVTKQLDKIMSTVPSMNRHVGSTKVEKATTVSAVKTGKKRGRKPVSVTPRPQVAAVKGVSNAGELATYIQSKKAGSNQRVKFLATAVWLSKKKGMANLVTRDITNTLKAAKVRALINPSQYLNQNVKQGFLKRSGDHFVLTKKGETAI